MSGLGRWRERRWFPMIASAVAGLVVGLAGIGVGTFVSQEVLGASLGAVGGGVTAAYISDEGLAGDVANALVADVLSSILFFLLVLAAYLGYVAATERLALISAGWFSTMYVVFGGLFAIPVALVSLVIAGLSGLLTSIAKRAVSVSNHSRR